MHSRTAEAVMRNLEQIAPPVWRWFFSHDKPIPDCFNDTVERAYAWGADLFWIVEDDVVPPPATFGRLLKAIRDGADVAVSDYLMEDLPPGKLSWGVNLDGIGRVTWCRTGCILFTRECLERMPRPWFRLRNRLLTVDGTITWDEGEDRGYGCDVPFTFDLFQLGARFEVIDITCDHLRVVEWGNARGNNTGFHRIEPLQEAQWQDTTVQMDRSKSAQPAIAR